MLSANMITFSCLDVDLACETREQETSTGGAADQRIRMWMRMRMWMWMGAYSKAGALVHSAMTDRCRR